MIVDNCLRIGIFAKEEIPKDGEITMEFDYDWKQQFNVPNCACGRSNCDMWVFITTT